MENLFAHVTIKIGRNKTWDKNYHWLQQVVEPKILNIFGIRVVIMMRIILPNIILHIIIYLNPCDTY